MALNRRTGGRCNGAVKLDGAGRAVALLAGNQIGFSISAMGIGRGEGQIMRSGKARPARMTSGRNAVTVGKISRKTAWRIRKRAETGPTGFVTQDAASINCLQGNRSVGGVIGRFAIVIGTLPVGRMSSGSWMTGRGRT